MSVGPDRGALDGVRVIDLSTGVAGHYATKLMAGFGAEVIKLEPPVGGDTTRSAGPFVGAEPHRERSFPYLWLNTGKKSVALDVEQPSTRPVLNDLFDSADLVVETFGPRKAEALGFAPESLVRRHPQLIVVTISNFGLTGPYRDFEAEEIVEYAMSGLMHLTGDPDLAPLASAPALTHYTAGMNAYVGALMALFQRASTGRGQVVEVSIQESALDNIEIAFAEYLHTGAVARRTGDEHTLVPWQLFPCRDGYAAVVGGPVRHWNAAADLFEEPRLLTARYWHMRDRMNRRQEVKDLIQPWLDRNDAKHIYHSGQARKLAFGYLAELDDVLSSPQLRARRFFVDIDHPETGTLLYCGAPFRLDRGGWSDARAPLLGEHDGLLDSLTPVAGPADDSAGRQAARVAPGRRPLEGIRVVDLTHDWAGPHATRLLADFGAEVIKIENVRRLDGMRGAILEDRAYDKHPRWLEINRNKLSVTLDLHSTRGARAFKALVRVSDVVIESSRVGVLERFGLGIDVLRSVRPDIILVRMSPFGQTGPEASYGGYGGCLEPLSGIQTLTGYAADAPPRRIREMDVTNGIMGACAIMTALVHRGRTGAGQVIDVSELETAAAGLIGEHLLEFAVTGKRPPKRANRHPVFAPQGCYRCREDDAWLVIAVRDSAEWSRLCHLVDRPDLASGQLAEVSERRRRHDEIDAVIEGWTSEHSRLDAMNELQAIGIPAGAVLTVSDLAQDAHLLARGFVRAASDGSAATYPGLPFRLSEGVGDVRMPGPALGEHNHQVLVGLLGWPDADVDPVDEANIGTSFDPDPALSPLIVAPSGSSAE